MLQTPVDFQLSYDDDLTAQIAEEIFQEEIAVVHKAAMDEWIHVIAKLWVAIGRDLDNLDAKDLATINLYGEQLRDIPLGLLEIGVNYAIKNNTYKTVATIGLVMEGVRAELKKLPIDPKTDIDTKIERWVLNRLQRGFYRFGD